MTEPEHVRFVSKLCFFSRACRMSSRKLLAVNNCAGAKQVPLGKDV